MPAPLDPLVLERALHADPREDRPPGRRRLKLPPRSFLLLALALFLFSHVLSLLLGPRRSLAGTSRSIRVLFRDRPAILRIEADDLRATDGTRRFAFGRSLSLRTQGRGFLFLVGPKDLRISERPEIRLRWKGPARFSWTEGNKETNRKAFGSMAVRSENGRLRIVFHVPLELYLTGVLASEMGTRFPLEALKAQAVAARSYAISCRTRAGSKDFDLFDDAKSQVFEETSTAPEILEVVRRTRGEVLWFEGEVLRAYYHSTCGGRTRDGRSFFRDVPSPPFRPVRCPWDRASPLHAWKRLWTPSRMEAIGLPTSGGRPRIEVLERSERGDWIRLRIRFGSGPWRVLAGSSLRRNAKLPSLWIRSWRTAGKGGIVFEGRGFGHGVGLCQYGAAGWARKGADYRRILAHYYPGTTIAVLP